MTQLAGNFEMSTRQALPATPRVNVAEGGDIHRLEIVSAGQADKIPAAQWDRLARHALVDNPYFARQYVLAGISALKSDADVSVLVLRDGSGQLSGLVPFRKQPFAPLVPLGCARSAVNMYQVSGTPLIERDKARGAVSALFASAGTDGLPARWVFPHTDLASRFAKLCAQLAPSHGMSVEHARAYDRPRLTRMEGGFQTHVDAILGKKRVKDSQRAMRRLGEMGELRFERASDPYWVQSRIEDFLALELRGWKGRQRTAFASNADHLDFARKAFAGEMGEQGLTSVDSLLLDGEPIAMSINVQAGRTMFTPKCAFDEDYRKFGPGLILEYLVIETFYKTRACDDMDASTTAEGHIVSGFWNSAKPMGSLIMGPRGWQTRLLAQIEDTGHEAKKLAKRVVGRT
jgi:CelD/BcsL family acetyltransferase involved in cellulose biosynthesis